jgi:hypothetical protein
MSEQPKKWRSVQMGSEGWTVFSTITKDGSNYSFDVAIANNLTEEDAKLIAGAPQVWAALENIAGLESTSCPRCEGSGALYADGRAHYPSEGAPTRACPYCGGEGRLPTEDAVEIATTALAALRDEPEE